MCQSGNCDTTTGKCGASAPAGTTKCENSNGCATTQYCAKDGTCQNDKILGEECSTDMVKISSELITMCTSADCEAAGVEPGAKRYCVPKPGTGNNNPNEFCTATSQCMNPCSPTDACNPSSDCSICDEADGRMNITAANAAGDPTTKDKKGKCAKKNIISFGNWCENRTLPPADGNPCANGCHICSKAGCTK